MSNQSVYDPLDYDNLTKNCVFELMNREPKLLPLTEEFIGAGVYALFYTGDFEPYLPVKSPEATSPIYVGSAVPAGVRKGSVTSMLEVTDKALFSRINDHSRSIQYAENLNIQDFVCRFLVVKPLWIVMIERFLIDHYKPIWNVCIEGFGLHDPGKGRHAGEIPWWDALHPGRPWAKSLQQTKTSDVAKDRLKLYLESRIVKEVESEKP